jgi:hypothetical protein
VCGITRFWILALGFWIEKHPLHTETVLSILLILSMLIKLFLVIQDLLHTPDLPVCQTDLDPMRVGGGVGQKVFDGADGLAASPLVLFEDDGDAEAGADIFTLAIRHTRFRISDFGFGIWDFGYCIFSIRNLKSEHAHSRSRFCL